MEDYAPNSFSEVNWGTGSIMVDDVVVEPPRDPFVDDEHISIDYFEDKNSMSDLPSEMQEYISKMNIETEDALELLLEEDGLRTLQAFLGEGPTFISRPDIAYLTGINPEPFVSKMEELDLLQTDLSESRKKYRIDMESDAYWFLQVSNAVYEHRPGPNRLQQLKNGELGNEIVQDLGRKDFYQG